MKVVAMYLPQYYRTEENDLWWGKGFTDWVSTKNAKPLFNGHIQPKKPLDGNYYDLIKKETMIWQAKLMKEYGIDGMCIYHYWFSNGRQVLEKPVENLLQWKEIDMPFCLCWANETWARSWSNIKNSNVWSYVEEPSGKCGKEILLEQEYGEENEWLSHIQYLIRCFKDKRYIRIDNKPVLVIYKTELIVELKAMLGTWKKYLADNGLDGIYIIGANASSSCEKCVDAVLFHEPSLSVSYSNPVKEKTGILKFDYGKIWEKILNNFNPADVKTYYGGFVNYDDTPRRGGKGVVIENATPELFKKNVSKLIKKNEENGNEIKFINAWNEWGEGMYLEPDVDHGYAYLQALKEAKECYLSAEDVSADFKQYFNEVRKKSNINKINMDILDSWLLLNENKISIYDWFKKNSIKEVAIYGYGILAKHLTQQLQHENIVLKYVIDQNKKVTSNIEVYCPEEALPSVEAIVVCVPYYYGDIKELLKGKLNTKIISIQTIIEELQKYN